MSCPINRKILMHGFTCHYIFSVILVVCMVVVPACGRKAPPMPLTAVDPPVVKNFQAQMEGVKLKLTWPVPEWKKSKDEKLAGFYVYGAMEKLSEDGCKNCPKLFERVADIPITSQFVGPGAGIAYEAPLEKGSRYYYKVSCYTDKGNEGALSKIVTIDY